MAPSHPSRLAPREQPKSILESAVIAVATTITLTGAFAAAAAVHAVVDSPFAALVAAFLVVVSAPVVVPVGGRILLRGTAVIADWDRAHGPKSFRRTPERPSGREGSDRRSRRCDDGVEADPEPTSP